MAGAYLVNMRYVDVNGGVEPVYPDELPPLARRFVLHDPDAWNAKTGLDVETPLSDRILKHVTAGDPILGATWDPDAPTPVSPAPPPIVAWDAPAEERAAFLTAVLDLKAAVNRNIARHYVTHVKTDDVEDNVVKAVEYIFSLAEIAEGLL